MFCDQTIKKGESNIKTLHVLGFAGSLRKASYNRAALRAASQLVPSNLSIEVFELDNIPMYNADIEKQGFPESVQEFKGKIAQADGLLIVTPEYNYSIPGVLKNAIDWASRPPTDSPLNRKPVALMGASPSGFGTVRGQLQLRQVFLFTNSLALVTPQVHISRAQDKFDRDGNLIDEVIVNQIRTLLHAFGEWIISLQD